MLREACRQFSRAGRLELCGATLYMFQAVPWAFARSLALFIAYSDLRSFFMETLTLVVSLSAATERARQALCPPDQRRDRGVGSGVI